MTYFEDLFAPLADYPLVVTLISIAGLLFVAWLANFVIRRVLLRVVGRLVAASRFTWDDALLSGGVLSRFVHAVPAMIIASGIGAVPGLHPAVDAVVRNVSLAFIALTIALSINYLLNAIDDLYVERNARAAERPIKGYLQVVKIFVFVITGVLIIAALVDRSPLLLLSGLGAMSAVMLLVFKDSILSLVASIQLSSYNMLRVGDWIEMPSQNTDGDVIDIALNTVKVQNWDKTISTIPTYKLISESFRNWRGMVESGGRRIKRALLIDQTSVRFLTEEETERLRRFALIDDYIDSKQTELEAWNEELLAAGRDPANTRRVTNLGTFRAYVDRYLRAHPGINQDMTMMVRQLDPTEHGIPLQLYCFTSTIKWVGHENTQSDIFDHLLAILPEFGLRLYQAPSGADVGILLNSMSESVDDTT